MGKHSPSFCLFCTKEKRKYVYYYFWRNWSIVSNYLVSCNCVCAGIWGTCQWLVQGVIVCPSIIEVAWTFLLQLHGADICCHTGEVVIALWTLPNPASILVSSCLVSMQIIAYHPVVKRLAWWLSCCQQSTSCTQPELSCLLELHVS